MRSFMLMAAALLSNAVTTLADTHAHAHAHKAVAHAQLRRREEADDEVAQLRKRELQRRHREAVEKREATAWDDTGYENPQYVDDCIKHHNDIRDLHLSPNVVWDHGLAYSAQLVAQSCVYAHDLQYDPDAGQNIAAGMPASNVSAVITELWYNEECSYFLPYYGEAQPDSSEFHLWGHMTQLVWKKTFSIGCATQFCPDGLANVGEGVESSMTVCNYREAGNMDGEYDINVSPPQGELDLHWDS